MLKNKTMLIPPWKWPPTEMNTPQLSKRQTRHVQYALSDRPDSDLYDSDLFLRKCFNHGEDVISVVDLHTIDKAIASNVETGIMQFMWSMATKTRKLKNVAVSAKNCTVNHKLSAQLVWHDLQHGRIYCLSSAKIGTKSVRYIDRKGLEFGLYHTILMI